MKQVSLNSVRTEPSRAPSAAEASGLPRKLGLISAMAVLVGSTIGSGIFRSPAGIAAKIPSIGVYVAIWVLGGLFTLCGALTYAELSALFPNTGGVFVYLREGFGRLPAFLFGWSELLILRASALGAIATVFAEYLLRLLGQPVTVEVHSAAGIVQQSAPAVHYVAIAAIVLVAGFNIAGVNLGAVVQNLTTAGKYGALLVLAVAAFLIGPRLAPPTTVQPVTASSVSVASFGLALISILWVYDGWADVTFVSGEVKRPSRNLPLALILGTFSVLAIYLLINLAYLRVLDINQIAGSKLVAADAAYRIVGTPAVRLVSLAVMISAFGTLNGSMMTGPRIFFAMADEGLFLRKIAAVHPRLKTPYVAICLAAALAVLFVMIRTFEQLADTFVLGIWPFYAGGIAAVYTLRRKRPDLPRPYKVLGYPVSPAIFLLATVFLLGNALVDDVRNVAGYFKTGAAAAGTGGTLLVFTIILAGIPVYLLWFKLRDQGIASTAEGKGA